MPPATILVRWLKPSDTAAYIGKPKASLKPLCRAGLLPKPSYHFGPKSPRYDREAIDAMISGTERVSKIDAAIAGAIECEQNRQSRRIHRQAQAR